MQITEIRVSLRQGDENKLLAFANVTFDNSFAVRGIKIIHGTNGPFIAMPSRKLADGRCWNRESWRNTRRSGPAG
jgi:stage V sporulation protein G